MTGTRSDWWRVMKIRGLFTLVVIMGLYLAYISLKPSPRLPMPPEVVSSTPTIVKEYIDREGTTHTVYLPAVVSREDLRNPEIPLGIVDTAAMLLKIAREDLISVKKLYIKAQDSLLKAKVELNAKNQKIAVFQDQIASLSFNYSDTTFGYSFVVEPTISDYNKRKWLLGKNRTYVDVAVPNVSAGNVKLRTFTHEAKQPLFSAKVSAISDYNLTDQSLVVGAKLGVDVGRIGVRGSYMYSPSLKQWTPVVGLEVKMWEF